MWAEFEFKINHIIDAFILPPSLLVKPLSWEMTIRSFVHIVSGFPLSKSLISSPTIPDKDTIPLPLVEHIEKLPLWPISEAHIDTTKPRQCNLHSEDTTQGSPSWQWFWLYHHRSARKWPLLSAHSFYNFQSGGSLASNWKHTPFDAGQEPTFLDDVWLLPDLEAVLLDRMGFNPTSDWVFAQ